MKTLTRLMAMLRKGKLTVAVAESASGGYVSYLFTSVPGSSKIFKGGLVVYSLEAKHDLLNVSRTLLSQSQGVSPEVACLLAANVRRRLHSSIGASLVGYAGPHARSGVKPGTMYLAVSTKHTLVSRKTVLTGSRNAVRKKAGLLLIRLIEQEATSLLT